MAEKVVKLDLKDRKILFELDLNSRQPYAAIAKKVGLSKQVVKFRVERLVRKGVIKKFVTLWNISKLGYSQYNIYLRFKRINYRDRILRQGLSAADAIVTKLEERAAKGKKGLRKLSWEKTKSDISEMRRVLEKIQDSKLLAEAREKDFDERLNKLLQRLRDASRGKEDDSSYSHYGGKKMK